MKGLSSTWRCFHDEFSETHFGNNVETLGDFFFRKQKYCELLMKMHIL